MDAFSAAYDAVLDRWPTPREAVDVPTRFGTTRVQVCGPAAGPPVVLLHGGGATSTVWFANAEALRHTHRVLAPDIMVPNGAMRSRDDLLSWLDEVLDHFALTDVALCGHSYGAKIALAYALHAPRRVRRLVLLDPTTCFAGMSPRYLLHAAPLLLRPSGRRLRRFFGWEAAQAGPLDAGWLDRAAAAAEVRTKLVIPRRPAAEPLRGLEVPTLVLLAQRSRAHDVDRVAAGARRLLPNATVQVLPDVSHHGMPIRHAERLNRELLAFLA